VLDVIGSHMDRLVEREKNLNNGAVPVSPDPETLIKSCLILFTVVAYIFGTTIEIDRVYTDCQYRGIHPDDWPHPNQVAAWASLWLFRRL
jgi:hypothetical protein